MTKDDLKKMFFDVVARIQEHTIAGYGAQTAFFTILSVFPFLILFISMIQFLNISPEGLTRVLNDFLPLFLEDKTSAWVNELYSHSMGTISVSILFLLWSSAKALHSMKYGLDTVNAVTDKRRWLMIRFSAMLHTLLFIVMLAAILLFVIFGSYLVVFVEQLYLDNGGTPTALSLLLFWRYLIVFAITTLFIDLAYTKLPNIPGAKLREHLPSAVVCSVIWFILTLFFSMYIRIYELFTMYGTLTTVLMALIWVYFMMMVLFGCAECNPEILFFWEMWKEHSRKKKAMKKALKSEGIVIEKESQVSEDLVGDNEPYASEDDFAE